MLRQPRRAKPHNIIFWENGRRLCRITLILETGQTVRSFRSASFGGLDGRASGCWH